MNDNDHIDKLLKESFDGFAPDAPDVWSKISKTLGNQAVQAATQANVAAKAATTISTKLITLVTVAAIGISATAYLVLQSNHPPVQPIPEKKTIEQNALTQEIRKHEGNQPQLNDVIPPKRQELQGPVAIKSTPKKPQSRPLSTIKTKQREATATPNNEAVVKRPEEKHIEGAIREVPVSKQNSLQASVNPNAVAKAQVEHTQKPQPLPQDKTQQAPTTDPFNNLYEEAKHPTIPNVFTPDNNGINDRFEIRIENESFYHLIIKEKRMHKTVFESREKTKTWDGININTGNLCETGDYLYEFYYKLEGNEKTYSKKGWVKLER